MAARNPPQPGGLGSPPGAPIQVVPPGLLGLLQLKSLGSAPQQLLEQVSGVIELRDWYLTARRLDTFAIFGGVPIKAIATAVLGNQPFNVAAVAGGLTAVPQAEIWYVEQMTAGCDPTGAETATDLVRYAPAVINATNNAYQLVGPDVSDTTLAARTRTLSARSDRGFWAFPGDFLGVRVFDNLTTNGWTFSLEIRATRCPL